MSSKEVEELNEKLKTLEESPFGVHFDPIETLQECLYHRNDKIRSKAARLAGSFPNADFIEPLFRLVAENTNLEVRKAALEALGSFLHQGRMADYHREPEADWELESEDEMSELTRDQYEAIRDFMMELVKQETWPSELRSEALRYYARLEPEDAATQVDRFYRSNDETLKVGAVKALPSLETGNWEQMILQEISRHQRDERLKSSLEAAGTHRVADAGPRLLDLLEECPDQEIREKAAEALSLIPWAKAGEHLQKFTEDRNPRVSNHAQNGLIRQQSHLDLEDMPDPSDPSAGGEGAPGPEPRRPGQRDLRGRDRP
jgi:HEAT repeat protein